jgi:type I restriction enzyme S subunit
MAFSRFLPGFGTIKYYDLHILSAGNNSIAFIAQKAVGATMLNLNTSILREIPVRYPDLAIQRRIASILSAYDDLIENNTRRIAILEEMARRIYEEWFVHFRFPGHEDVRMVESELGAIPEQWCVLPFSELADVARNGINPSAFPDEIFDHFSIPAFDDRCRPDSALGRTILSSKYVVQSGQVLLSKLNPRIPRIWLIPASKGSRQISSTEFLVFQPRPNISAHFLFELCSSDAFLSRFSSLALGTSTSHQRVKPQEMLAFQIVKPAEEIHSKFVAIVKPMHGLIEILRSKTSNLRTTRDLLLPKLISGELDVSQLPEPEDIAA